MVAPVEDRSRTRFRVLVAVLSCNIAVNLLNLWILIQGAH